MPQILRSCWQHFLAWRGRYIARNRLLYLTNLEDYKDVDSFLSRAKDLATARVRVGLGLCGLFIAVALLPTRYLEIVVKIMNFFAKGRPLEPLSPAGERTVFLAMAILLGPVFIVIFQNIQIQAVVLWVRRFHQKQRAWGVHRQLDLGCRGIASLITLQDSSIPVSLWAGLHTFIGFYVVSLTIINALVPLGMIVLPWMYDEPIDLLAIAWATLSLLVAGSLCFWLLRRMAVVRAKEHKPRKALLKRIRRIRKSPIFAGGTFIVRCPENDTSWRDVVRLGIEHADGVVVDLTSFSDNVVWELSSALATHPPSKVLLLYSDEMTADRQSLFDLVESRIGASAIVRCRWLVYPAALPRHGDERTK